MILHSERVYQRGTFREAYVVMEDGRITDVTADRPAAMCGTWAMR